jgi:hypothetical protein
MGKNAGAKQRVVEYRMSVHMGVALSLDAVTGIYANDKTIWEGDSSTAEVISVNLPDLYGGDQKEGGVEGLIYHLPGRQDQLLPAELVQRLDPAMTPQTCPAFRGITTLFFTGNTTGVPAQQGQTQSNGVVGALINGLTKALTGGGAGFKWSTNNPIIAQTLKVRGRRASVAAALNPAWQKIGKDSNPAFMIYECLTDPGFGMGAFPSSVDTASFNSAAQALFNENFGLTMFWNRQSTIENFVGEINDHIQALIYLSPKTGLWTIKLLRADYNPATVREINPSNATLTNFQRRFWGEAVNEISVSWTDPTNEQSVSVTQQDLASVVNQGVVQDSRDYYGIRTEDLAQRVCARDVRAAAAPLASATAELDRTVWDVTPGEVFRLNWPEKNIFNVYVRALVADYGDPSDSTIKLSLLEDIFSLDLPPVNSTPDNPWSPPGVDPKPLAATEVITLPAYFVASNDLQTTADDLDYPEALAAVLGYPDNNDTPSFELMAQGVDSTGAATWNDQGTKNITARAVLDVALAREAVSSLPATIVADQSRGPRIGGFVLFGVGGDAAMEFAQVTAYDAGNKVFTLSRGVLDTVPTPWPVGTPCWFVNPGERIVDDRTVRAAGEVVNYKLLARTSKGVLDLATATTITDTLDPRAHRPLRPANVKLNATDPGQRAIGGTTTMTVTWATRNRTLEDGTVYKWTGRWRLSSPRGP